MVPTHPSASWTHPRNGRRNEDQDASIWRFDFVFCCEPNTALAHRSPAMFRKRENRGVICWTRGWRTLPMRHGRPSWSARTARGCVIKSSRPPGERDAPRGGGPIVACTFPECPAGCFFFVAFIRPSRHFLVRGGGGSWRGSADGWMRSISRLPPCRASPPIGKYFRCPGVDRRRAGWVAPAPRGESRSEGPSRVPGCCTFTNGSISRPVRRTIDSAS